MQGMQDTAIVKFQGMTWSCWSYLRMASPRFLDEDSPLDLVAPRPRSPLATPLPTARPPTGKPPRLCADLWGLVAAAD